MLIIKYYYDVFKELRLGKLIIFCYNDIIMLFFIEKVLILFILKMIVCILVFLFVLWVLWECKMWWNLFFCDMEICDGRYKNFNMYYMDL